ncbi:MAG: UPF0149 family protein [Methylococcaceae bacterium]
MAYQTINAILTQNDPALSAAEAHGMATGMLCVNTRTMNSYWLSELLPKDNSISDDNKALLTRLFEETRRLLTSEEFDFDLFLPDDDSLLSEQVTALRNWCQGFLFGVGSTRLSTEFNEDSREIVKDISEFTKLSTEVEGEEDESAFIEITEYLRSAVLLLRDELNDKSGTILH